MSHDHDHGAGAPPRVLALVLGITVFVLAAQTVGALWSGSLALMADAGHLLTDAGGLVMALFAAMVVRRPATDRLTWGYRRVEVLAAAAQGLLLSVVATAILVSAFGRLVQPKPVESGLMLWFGALGLLGNLVAMAVLLRARSSHGENLNTRAALLEVAADALGSLAVLLAAAVVAATGWLRADAVASALIAALILPRTVGLLRQAVRVLLEATPAHLDLADVRSHLLSVPHVVQVHDLHASTVGTGLPVLSAHVVVEDACFHDGHLMGMLDDLQECLIGHFDVHHSTFQFESVAHAEHEHQMHA